MFYYPTVLQRHTGCFSTIWLVATKAIRVTRRDFLRVNVIRTCDDLMSYMLEQMPPPRPGLPRPRFSLYLSSQLQYGVILVYHRQCALFLEELMSVVRQFFKRSTQKIDMEQPTSLSVDLLDALVLQEEFEKAPDPLFGLMDVGETFPSPTTMIQMGQKNLRETSPQLPELDKAAASARISTTTTPDSITLREVEPDAFPLAEFEGEELVVDQHPQTIDLLLAQKDTFPEGEELELHREVTPVMELERGERGKDLERLRRTGEITASSLELQPPTRSSDEVTLLPQEEPDVTVQMPGLPSDQVTPVSLPALPSPQPAAREPGRPARPTEESPDVALPQVRRRRRRQLVFHDAETQISDEDMQWQLDHPEMETRPALFPPPPSQRKPRVADLLNNPCITLPEELQFLWEQAAIMEPLPHFDFEVQERESETTSSERERDRELMEAAEAAEREVPRDVQEPEMFDISEPGSVLLGRSDLTEVTEILPQIESERDGSGSVLQETPVVVDEMPDSAASPSPGLLVDLPEQEDATVLFHSLLPADINRRVLSHTFYKLLGILSAGRLTARQDEPYADILINLRANHEETLLHR